MGPQSSQNTARIAIRGSANAAAKAAQVRLERPDLVEVVHGLNLGPTASVVVECKSSNKEVSLEQRKDSLWLSIPARGLDPKQIEQSTARVLIGYAIKQHALDAAESFLSSGVECPKRHENLEKLLRSYAETENQPRFDRAVVLARALAPYRQELEQCKGNISDKLKTPELRSIDNLLSSCEIFCQRITAFRAVSGLLGDRTAVSDLILQRIKERVAAMEDLFARAVYRGEHSHGQTVMAAMELMHERVAAAGWFKEFPRILQPAQLPDGFYRGQQLLLNTSLWNDSQSSQGAGLTKSSRATSGEMVSNALASMLAGLQYALALDIESRQVSRGPELGFDLLEEFISVCPLVPAVVTTLGPQTSAEQLSDLGEFLKILLRIKYCDQLATKNFYEYVVYDVIPDGDTSVGESVHFDVGVRPNFLLLQYVALIATSEPSVAGDRLKVFQEELLLIASRAINSVNYQYRSALAAHLKMGGVFDQHSLGVVLSDLEALEKGMQLIVNFRLEGTQSYGFDELLNAIKILRESFSKVALLELPDTELATRVDEVLALKHSGPYADHLREVTARLTDRMKVYVGTKAEEASAKLEALSKGESIIPIVEYAQEILGLIKADPTSEISASLRSSVGAVLLDMARVLEGYYQGEISRAARSDASVEDIYRSLEASYHLLIETSFVRDQLSTYADQLPELLLSKCQVLAEESPRELKRSLRERMSVLEEALRGLYQDLSSSNAPTRERAKCCIEGLQRVRIPRSSLSEPARVVYDRLVGKRAGI